MESSHRSDILDGEARSLLFQRIRVQLIGCTGIRRTFELILSDIEGQRSIKSQERLINHSIILSSINDTNKSFVLLLHPARFDFETQSSNALPMCMYICKKTTSQTKSINNNYNKGSEGSKRTEGKGLLVRRKDNQ